MPFLKNISVLQKAKLKFWIREIFDKINCKCSMKNQTLKMQRRQLKMQSPIFIYLKRTNFQVYVFSQISRSLVGFAKLKQAKISFKRHSRKYIHAKYGENSYFAKISSQKKCTKLFG